MDLTEKLKQEAKRLINEKKVDVIIGYTKGTLPLRSTPIFIRELKDIDCLIFDFTCANNLARYVTKFKEKVGVIAKGCDGRALVTLVVDKQIKKENLLCIGVPCKGVIDIHKLYHRLDGQEIMDYSISREEVIIKGRTFEKILDITDVLSDSCRICQYKTPPVYDMLLGEEIKEDEKPFEELKSFEQKSPAERWRFFEQEFSRCIRCYACRQVCPVCICEYCIVDRTKPQWFGKTTNLSDTMMFHLIRAYHTAGRCVDCGACVRACPMEIALRLLNKKLELEVLARFDFQAGVSLANLPPLSIYKEEDEQEFIM